MGFDAQKGQLAWVHTHGASVIGGAAAAGALVACDDQGKITVLDVVTGLPSGELDLGEAVKSCTVQADGFAPPRSSAPAERLADQLEKAVTYPDLELTTAQRLLLRELAAAEDESATRVLVHLASDPRTSPDLKGDARTALAARRNGAQYM